MVYRSKGTKSICRPQNRVGRHRTYSLAEVESWRRRTCKNGTRRPQGVDAGRAEVVSKSCTASAIVA